MIKAIIFDFGQTLVDASEGFKLGEKVAQRNIFEDLGLEDWESFLEVYRNERKKHHRKKIFRRVPFWKSIYRYFGRKPDDSKLSKWEDEYWNIVDKNRKLFPETETVIEKLSKKYKLGIVTNYPREGKIGAGLVKEYSNIGKYFSTIIIAGTEKIPPKPDPEPFKIGLCKLNIQPSEAIFVGDDLEIDIYGALNAGINPIWLQHRLVKRKWEKPSIDVLIIHSLEDLLCLEKLLELQFVRK